MYSFLHSRGGFSQSARSPGGYKTYQIPGPGSYDVGNRFGGPGYSLRSRVKPLDRNQTPGPGAYELSDEMYLIYVSSPTNANHIEIVSLEFIYVYLYLYVLN